MVCIKSFSNLTLPVSGTVSNIIDEWKKGIQGSDYESVRDLAIHGKKEGINLGDFMSTLRLKNYIKQIGAEEERVEQFIAKCAAAQDPQKLVDVLEKIGHIDVPLEELEEHIKQKQAEKETLSHVIDESRVVIDSVNVDRQIIEDFKELKNEMNKYHLEEELEEHIKQKQAEKETLLHEIDESRVVIDSVNVDRQIIEDFKELKNEMNKYHLEDPKKFLDVLRALKKYKYDDKRIMAEFSIRRSMKKERLGIEFDGRRLEDRMIKVKDLLPLAEQIMRLKVGIGELLAFRSVVYEKADVERIPLDTAAYKVVEDIRDYSQLGGLKKEQDRVQQQIYMFNALMANKQQAIMALLRVRG